MKKDLHCPYSILNADIICEHKSARIDNPGNVTLHNHDGYELLLFLKGDASVFVESEEKKLEPGDIIMIRPYLFHGIRVADISCYERVVLNIRPEILQNLSDGESDLSLCFHASESRLNLLHLTETLLSDMLALLDNLEAALNNIQIGHTVLSRALLAEFLVLLCRQTTLSADVSYHSVMFPVVSEIFAFIETHITENITVASLAQALHHNGDYLSRIFKKTTGSSLKHYINAKKISLAQQYLHKGYSPYDVCFLTGYNNYSSFSRRFKEQIGESPKQYQLRFSRNVPLKLPPQSSSGSSHSSL